MTASGRIGAKLRARRSALDRRLATLGAEFSYRVDPALCYLVALLYPGFTIFPSSLIVPVANALTVTRLGIFLAFPFAVRELIFKLARGGFVLILSDLLAPATMIWMVATLVIHQGPSALVSYGAIAGIEFWVAYMIGRMFFGTPAGYAQFIRILKVVVCGAIVFALLDTATSQHIVMKIGGVLTKSAAQLPEDIPNYRFGLIRAQGGFEHPILLGTFFAICMTLFFHSTMSAAHRALWMGACLFGAFLALSSAPILSMAIFGGAATFSHVFQRYRWRWAALGLFAVFAVSCLFLLVDDPLETLIRNLTIDPQTGLFRMQIWHWVGINVAGSPWLGIGYADWIRSEEMPPSIDSLWLIQTIRHGVPGLALLALTVLSTGIALPLQARKARPHPFIAMARDGLGVAIFVYAFNAFTVHLWGGNWALFAAILGMRAGFTEAQYLSPIGRADDAIHVPAPIQVAFAHKKPRAAKRPQRAV